MNQTSSELQLFSVKDAARVLGGISPWTLRKHIQYGNVLITRIGTRVFLNTEELERIRREGLPSLGKTRAERPSDAPGEATT